jgi:hypothetical protein
VLLGLGSGDGFGYWMLGWCDVTMHVTVGTGRLVLGTSSGQKMSRV